MTKPTPEQTTAENPPFDRQAYLTESLTDFPGKGPKYSTGLKDLDEIMGGFGPGELWVIGGRPQMAKSTLALKVAAHVAEHDGPALLWSLEMLRDSIWKRYIGSEARVQFERMDRPTERDSQRMNHVINRVTEAKLPLIIMDGPAHLERMVNTVRHLHQTEPLSIFMLDYVQLLTTPEFQTTNEAQRIGYIAQTLKNLAMELRIPIVLVSTINRNPERRVNRRPMLSDLHDSGMLESHADGVLFLYREEIYNLETEDQGILEIHVAKNRRGPLGRVKCVFHNSHMRIGDWIDFYQ